MGQEDRGVKIGYWEVIFAGLNSGRVGIIKAAVCGDGVDLLLLIKMSVEIHVKL